MSASIYSGDDHGTSGIKAAIVSTHARSWTGAYEATSIHFSRMEAQSRIPTSGGRSSSLRSGSSARVALQARLRRVRLQHILQHRCRGRNGRHLMNSAHLDGFTRLPLCRDVMARLSQLSGMGWPNLTLG